MSTLEARMLSLGMNGSYPGTAKVWTDDGAIMNVQDSEVSAMTLKQFKEYVHQHSITGHTDLDTDFAEQYYNEARLIGFLNEPSNAEQIYHDADALGNTNLAAHVQDTALHQQSAKYCLEVAKNGKAYQTIADALAAVPTSGGESASSARPYLILVHPGVYEEEIVLDKQYVTIRGVDQRSCVLQFDNTTDKSKFPLKITVPQVRVENLFVYNYSSSGPQATALKITDTADSFVVVDRCRIESGGIDACVVEGVARLLNCSFKGTTQLVTADGGDVVVYGAFCEVTASTAYAFRVLDEVRFLATKCHILVDTNLTILRSGSIVKTYLLDITHQGASGAVNLVAFDPGSTKSGILRYFDIHDVVTTDIGAGLVLPFGELRSSGPVRMNIEAFEQTIEMGVGLDGLPVSPPSEGQDWDTHDIAIVRNVEIDDGATVSGPIVAMRDQVSGLGTANYPFVRMDYDTNIGPAMRARSVTTGETLAELGLAEWLMSSSTVTDDGGMIDSPKFNLRAAYDSDDSAAVVSTWREAKVWHQMDSGGASPASRLVFDIDGNSVMEVSDAGEVLATSFVGTGTGLVDLDADNLVTGTVPVARLDSSVSRVLYANTADSTAIANVSGDQFFDVTYTIPADTLTVGGTVRIEVFGKLSTLGAAPGTLRIDLLVGSVMVASTGSFTPTAGLSNRGWGFTSLLTVRSTGGSGTIMRDGHNVVVNSRALAEGRLGSATLDTTTGNAITVKCTWGTADPANTATLETMRVFLSA